MGTASTLVGPADVTAAADRIRGRVGSPPVVRVPGSREDAPLWAKLECLQPTGSFKVRGAVNAVSLLVERDAGREVVAQSSGNHALAVAYAAREYGLRPTVVLPDTAPEMKVRRAGELGARVVIVPPERRDSAARELRDRTGATMISSDDLDVIAGHATAGAEILHALPRMAAVLVPVCNGGLLAGVAVAVKSAQPHVKVIGVEPELAADAAESFRRGTLVRWPVRKTYRTVADGLRTPALGATAWEHIRRYVDDIVTVDEASIHDAVAYLRRRNVVAEPSGAVATAAYLTRAHLLPRGVTVAIVSGGNVAC